MSQEFQEAQKALYAKQCEECDVVITTALVPGKPAPKLVSKVRFEVMIDACFFVNQQDCYQLLHACCCWFVIGRILFAGSGWQDEAWLCDCGSGSRGRRKLWDHQARWTVQVQRCDTHWLHRLTQPTPNPVQYSLLQQHLQATSVHGSVIF